MDVRSGSTRRRPATSPDAGERRSRSSTTCTAGSSCTSSRRASCRTRAIVSASSTPSQATSTPISWSTAAATTLERERLVRDAGGGTVGTVGEIELKPGLINAVPGEARFSLDIRGVDEEAFRSVARDIAAFAERAAGERGMTTEYRQRQILSPAPLDGDVVTALETAVKATGEPYMAMHSGAAHDTMSIADRVPSAMVFVPCKDGISHSPEEDANPADAALGAEIMLNAIKTLSQGGR